MVILLSFSVAFWRIMFSRVKVSIDFVKINLLPEYYKTKTKIFEASTLDL